MSQSSITHTKVVEASDTGSVYAHVYRLSDGKRTGMNSWDSSFWECWWPSNKALAKRLAAANRWADECIEVCSRGEVSRASAAATLVRLA